MFSYSSFHAVGLRVATRRQSAAIVTETRQPSRALLILISQFLCGLIFNTQKQKQLFQNH